MALLTDPMAAALLASEHQPIEGMPARLGYLGYGQRARFGQILNDIVYSGDLPCTCFSS